MRVDSSFTAAAKDLRLVLIGMIVDAAVLGEIASRWERGLFGAEWANAVAQICVQHYRKYKQPPRAMITSLFQQWAERNRDLKTIEAMERFLQSLSDEYRDNYERAAEELNSAYVLDVANRALNRSRMIRIAGEVQELCNGQDDVEAALALMSGFCPVGIGSTDGYHLFTDREEIFRTFAQAEGDVLVNYDGALGQFMGSALERDGFVAFVAASKKGKTYALIDVAFRALKERRRVAFFEVGDLSRKQINGRFATRVAAHPYRSREWPVVAKYPRRFIREDLGDGRFRRNVEHEERVFNEPLTAAQAWKAIARLQRYRVRSQDSYFWMASMPRTNVYEIETTLQHLERTWHVPDVVVIDYADLLGPLPGFEGRESINETWRRLRILSQEWHCLVVTASQGNAASHTASIMGRRNFSDDRRKLDHPTGLIGIASTAEDHAMGVNRWNWMVRREEETDESRQVYVAGCLALAHPTVLSSW